MEHYKELKENMSNVEELIEEISSVEKKLKDKLIKTIKLEMDWARLRYNQSFYDYTKKIELADFYFRLNDILEELCIIEEHKISEIVRLKLEMEKAYSGLIQAVELIDLS